MESLHPLLLPALARLPSDRPVVLFTRHSIREQSANGFGSYSLPLTPEGVALAEAWGARLDRPLHTVLTSPVGRCVDTARAMVAGSGQGGLSVDIHAQLVEPGCYVHDIRAVAPTFGRLGPVEFANLHFREPVPGVRSPREGAGRLLGVMRASLGAPGTLSLLVSHDTILAAFIYTLLGIGRIGEADWPWMMEGAFLWFDDEQVHGLWRGEQFACRLDLFDSESGLP
ncbi:MAG: histidine phosphatase family protein [Pseudomonadota bacterium]